MRSRLATLTGGVLLSALACDRSSDATFLTKGWDSYKRLYIQSAGYIADPSRAGEVISEAQGYALLRAAWMRDEETFARVWQWTDRHLRRSDGLYSWRWTPAQGGRVLDANTASDADQEIALALLLASDAFHQPVLAERARDLLHAIRRHESIAIDGRWFPAAGNWAVSGRLVNLSYFMPYAYRWFAEIDPDGHWAEVIDTGYRLITETRRAPDLVLIPDFITVTENGRVALPAEHHGVSRDFSSDAMRIYWRIALDCQLHHRRRACEDALGADRLADLLARDDALYTRYRVDGTPLERTESVSFYAIAAFFLSRHAPETTRVLRAQKLSDNVLRSIAEKEDRYYDANWVWFGIAGSQHFLWLP